MGQTVISNRIKKVKGKFYDTGTSNKTFLKVAADLNKLGTKNYYFMLELKDPSLINVDPHSPNLTEDEVSRVMIECTRNMWYYIREVARIPQQGGVPSQYLANRGNIAQAWCMLHGFDSWLCLLRQMGKTESILVVYAWAYSFGTNESQFIFINKDGDNAKANLERLKVQIECLPKYLRFEQIIEFDEDTGKQRINKGTKSATIMRHPITNNKIIIKSQATNYAKALSLARGLTAPFLHFDEPEFTPHILTIVRNSYSTFQRAAETAKKNNALYGRAFTCTPGDLDTDMGVEASQILSNTARWTEHIYDMHVDKYNPENCEVRRYIKDNGSNGILYIEYNYKQLGRTEEWLKEMYDSIGDPITFKREILLQRIRGSSDSPFEQEQIEHLFNIMRKPIEELFILGHFRFDIYRKLDKHTTYIVGVDCSTGTGGDNNAISIINPHTLEVDAEFKSPYVGETLFENIIISLVREHIPRAILAIERNNVGDGIVDHLMHSPIRQNLYFDKDKDYVQMNSKENDSITSMLKKTGDQKRMTGVWTGGKSRDAMMAILIRHMHEYISKIYTMNIVEDIAKLVKKSSGRIEAGAGFHDDSVMSYLIALYVYYHGSNLAAFGFVKGSEEIQHQNQGLHYDNSIMSDILPQDIVEAIEKQQEMSKEPDFEAMMRQAIAQSQDETMALVKKGLSKDDVFSNTPKHELENVRSSRNIPLSFFDEIN